ncbi:hypothetical protein B7494_g3827 [Chlorociboria aeruginascens]|nr:hypothetical protein B7494_g3827 [Chlorociboria aeruginascens]
MSQRPQINFKSRTATDEAGQSNSGYAVGNLEEPNSSPARNPYKPVTNDLTPPPRGHEFTRRDLHLRPKGEPRTRSSSRRSRTGTASDDNTLTVQMHNEAESKKANADSSTRKPGLGRRPVGGSEKLGLFSGVYVPTCLNVLSILMFLRFGFLLGQSGVVGMLIASYVINFITTFSLSAIASNGTVRGGGAYYLISRSLGPEFGGSIGLVFYMGFVFNTGMNAVGLIDCIKSNFGATSGNWAQIMPEAKWYLYLWATVVLAVCTTICLAGSSMFARASNGLLFILLVATLSIPLSALVMPPFESRSLGIEYTGLSLQTFIGNLMPQLTRGAAGSERKGKENFQDLFGILFPATGGIFAGASMSGDLKNPSKSIPRGTILGLITTFVLYTLVILAMAATTTRASFYRNSNVIQETNISGFVVLAGEFASSLFSTLMGVIGSAKLLQALSRDNLIPGFSVFGQGTKNGDEPTYAIIITYVVAQVTMLCDLNQIASFVTMTYLMTFLVMNLACFLLKIGSAPNFRPSFHFFNWYTALAGTILSGAAMFFVDGQYATGCVGILVIIFLIIHYTSSPKSWGDVSQSLIYHQVRKYLLRLKQEHVKFWRPQILLFVNDPRRQYNLIQFCNSMKKGALYILAHVIITDDFGGSVPEARRQQAAWAKYIDFSKIKAFVNIAMSPAVEWGARNIVLSAGLGGMRPNMYVPSRPVVGELKLTRASAVLGMYNLDDLRSQPLIDVPEMSQPSSSTSDQATKLSRKRRNSKDAKLEGQLPTDSCRTEGTVSLTSYVTILEDLLLQLQINVAIARGFQNLEFPDADVKVSKKYIDLWPIQMTAEIASEGDTQQNVLTTNFDTYTLILQLGVILNTVPAWKKAYKLRVAVFVEYEPDVEEERGRVKELLENLRIEAEVLVFWLASGELPTYEIIVNGASAREEDETRVNDCLKGQEWWDEIQGIRGKRERTAMGDMADLASIFTTRSNWPQSSFQQGPRGEKVERFLGLRRLLRKSKRKHSTTMSGFARLGVSLGIRTHRLSDHVTKHHASNLSASEDSDSELEESDSDILVSEDDESDGPGSAASEGDIDDFESDDESIHSRLNTGLLKRRRSHGDSMRGPTQSKRATGEREPIPPQSSRRSPVIPSLNDSPSSPIATSFKSPSVASRPVSLKEPLKSSNTSRPSSEHSERPSLIRHASARKFNSKPMPQTLVSTSDGPGPSIMFTATSSPPVRKGRLPSAYRSSSSFPDHISETSEPVTPNLSRHNSYRNEIGTENEGNGSGYATQAIPISFNDLPCRAQHLILNELMRQKSADTAVLFTTLPSPVKGTSQSEEANYGLFNVNRAFKSHQNSKSSPYSNVKP